MAVARRWGVFVVSALPTLFSAWLFVLLARAEGWSSLDTLRLVLSTVCVFWLLWGAVSGMLGLFAPRRPPPAIVAPSGSRTAILIPIYHEDPPSTFARVAAISNRLTAAGAHASFDLFILSDSQRLDAAAREAVWLERLLTDCAGREHIFYRRRANNVGRKAGNVEDFIRRSGGAYAYALVLDADSLMDAEAILAMVAQMDAAPRLGLLQTLPVIVHAQSLFGRAIQFATHLYSPVYAGGVALLQGSEGPFWGHNAIFRVDAFAACCGLPELQGKPPFGGHVLSHDYIEAALLARGGYEVRLDPQIGGSFEEGPDNIIDFAKRDQRWCQGNLQHSRVLLAPELRVWNRLTLLQGIMAYLMPSLWLTLLIVSIVATQISPHAYWPSRPGWTGWAMIAIVTAVLIVPKLLIAVRASLSGDGQGLIVGVLAEIALSTIIAPIVLMFQIRAVMRVLFGFDGGWPASNRTDSILTLRQAWAGSWWITCCGATGLAGVLAVAPHLVIWTVPVALPMIVAPLIIAATSRPMRSSWLFHVPEETSPSPVLREWRAVHDSWTGATRRAGQDFSAGGAANVLG